MDHRYIDENSVAERYLAHSLSVKERTEFEVHLVDCEECTDRVLLAELFQNRNGAVKALPAPAETAGTTAVSTTSPIRGAVEQEAMRVRFVRLLSPWQLFWIVAVAAALLVLLPSLLVIWVTRGR